MRMLSMDYQTPKIYKRKSKSTNFGTAGKHLSTGEVVEGDAAPSKPTF